MADITLVSHLKSLSPIAPVAQTPAAGAGGFGELLKTAIADTNTQQIQADKAIENLQTGKSKNVHETMIAMEKADVSLRLLVQMRNKAVEAYQEIMRMQV